MSSEKHPGRPLVYGLSALFVCLAYTACGSGSSSLGGGTGGGTSGGAGDTGTTGGADGGGGHATGGTDGGTGGGTGGTAGQGGGGGAAPLAPILFRSNVAGNHIWSMDEDGNNRQQLTTTNSNGMPRRSPDGTKIAFDRNIGSNLDVWVMDADGSNQVNLTEGVTQNDAQTAWSSNGERIAFVSRRGPDNPSNRLGLYTMLADGSDVQRLLLDADSSLQHPHWSGNSIAFSFAKDGKWDIWVKRSFNNLAGTNLTGERFGDHTRPVISPNEQRILFVAAVSDEDADTEIFVMDFDGDNVEQLTDNEVNDDWPCFSPDGSQVLYSSQAAGTWDIWRMNVDGTNPENLTPDLDESDELHPDWHNP